MYGRGNMAEVGIIGGTPAIRLIVKFRFAKMDYIKHRLEIKEAFKFRTRHGGAG